MRILAFAFVVHALCLTGARLAGANETVTYFLVPGSTITVYHLDGAVVGPEPITGSFDWTTCGHTEDAACFDTTRLDFQSPSFSIHLHSPNELAGGILYYGIPLFDEAVDAPGIVAGLAEMTSVYREGKYSDYPEGVYDPAVFPLSLEYPDLRIYRFGGGPYIGALEIKAVVDRDRDGVLDDIDECLNTPADAVVGQHGCSIDQIVPCAGPRSGGQWKNHGQYVSAVSAAVGELLADNRLTQAEAEAVLDRAGRSACGKH